MDTLKAKSAKMNDDSDPDRDSLVATAKDELRTGRVAEAEGILEAILKEAPDEPEALHLLGLIRFQQGDPDKAIDCIKQAIAGSGPNEDFLHNLGQIYKMTGKLDDASACFRQALEIKPDYAEAHVNLGTVLQKLGNLKDAIASYNSALAIEPSQAKVHFNLGIALQDLGQWGDAVASYERCLSINPGLVEGHVNLGNVLKDLGRLEEAVASYEKALAINPNFAEGYSILGIALTDLGRSEDAVECFEKALAIKPEFVEAYSNMGLAFERLGRVEAATESCNKALAIKPDFAVAEHNLAQLYEKANDLDRAEVHVKRALDLDPNYLSAKITECVLLRRRGHARDAIDRLRRLSEGKAPPNALCRIHFELGKLYDGAHKSQHAFEHLAKGNKIRAESLPKNIDARRYLNFVEQSANALSLQFLDSWTDVPYDPNVDPPVFLLGFPRSGTTLLDQILDSHPSLQVLEEKPTVFQVYLALRQRFGDFPTSVASLTSKDIGELRHVYFQAVDEYIDRCPGTILVDKTPLNICYVPLIVRLFPNARIVLALRHPGDVVISCFMQNFDLNDAMANFLDLGDTVRLYVRVMGLWRQSARLFDLNVHAVKYEALITNFDDEVRDLLTFLGVGWNDSVLDFYIHAQNRQKINTPSYQQVTEPIHRRAMFRWKRYKDQLAPYMPDLSPFIEEFGYSPNTDGTPEKLG